MFNYVFNKAFMYDNGHQTWLAFMIYLLRIIKYGYYAQCLSRPFGYVNLWLVAIYTSSFYSMNKDRFWFVNKSFKTHKLVSGRILYKNRICQTVGKSKYSHGGTLICICRKKNEFMINHSL